METNECKLDHAFPKTSSQSECRREQSQRLFPQSPICREAVAAVNRVGAIGLMPNGTDFRK